MAIDISREREMETEGGIGENTSEAHTFIMRFVNKEIEDLLGHELTRFTNSDGKFARGTFGDRDITIILGELDGKGFYHQNLRKEVGRWEERGEGKLLSAPIFSKENAKRRPSKTTT
jgi:hypothetical protein